MNIEDINLDEIELVDPIDWNSVEDPMDLLIWDKLDSQVWSDRAFPIEADKGTWLSLSPEQRELTKHVFAGLTLLDTIQAMVGAEVLKADATSQHEAAVYTNIAMMENVHAKSYSKIFSTLIPETREIQELFQWAKNNIYLKRKQAIILHFYRGNDPLKKKAASTLLESFLFYSGFYLPLYWASQEKLTHTANLISLIIRDEAVHGSYIGYKYQRGLEKLSEAEKAEHYEWLMSLLDALLENEYAYTRSIYGDSGLVDEVNTFLRYNANKALMNLGYDPLFDDDECDVDPKILSALNAPITGATGDFFSGKLGYLKAKRRDLTEEEWSRFGPPARVLRRQKAATA